MGFLDQLGGLISPGLTAASGAIGAQQQAQKQANDDNQSKFLKILALVRQQQNDKVETNLKNAQIGNYDSETDARLHPKPVNPPAVVPAGSGVLGPDGKYTVPVPKPVAAHNLDPLSPEGIEAGGRRAKAIADNTPVGNTYTAGTDPTTGQPEIFAGRSKGPPSLTPMGVGKPAGGAGGSMSLSPEDRQKMMVQAQLDNQTMKDFEKKVLSGEANVGVGSAAAGGIGEMHGGGALSKILAPIGNSVVGATNPEYQKYLTAQRSYGRLMGNLQSKRYSDNQAEIERSIGGMGANDLPSTIQYKQQLRDASINDVAQPTRVGVGRGSGGPGPAAAPRGPGPSKPMSPAAYHAAQHAGYTDAEITAQGYAIPRGGE